MASPNTKNLAKKKKETRFVKSKQGKLDSRLGEQVKNSDGDKNSRTEKPKIKSSGQEENLGDRFLMNNCGDSEFLLSNSPTSTISGRNDSGVEFSVSSRSGSGSGSSSTSSSDSCSETLSRGDERDLVDNGCLDDWEAAFDALATCEKKQQVCGPEPQFGSPHRGTCRNSESRRTAMQVVGVSCKAWSLNDALRPKSLPSLTSKDSFPPSTERNLGCKGSCWGSDSIEPVTTSCPICCEDLDCTDRTFLPCLCGFRLCLFCHNRILEEDGRCPGCRKQYH